MNYAFIQTKDQGSTENIFGFGLLPLNVGDFQLSTDNVLYVKARTTFDQIFNEDVEGYEYKLIDADEGFLKIESFDSVKKEVKGRFKVKFRRTSKER